MPINKKTEPGDGRTGRKHPFKKMPDDEERKAFVSKQFRPKWYNHPIKHMVLTWFEENHSLPQIHEKIIAQCVADAGNLEDYEMSLPTLQKLRKRHLASIGQYKQEETEARITKDVNAIVSDEERVLRDTIKSCEKKKSDLTISAKDWQYYDMQQQAAIKLLGELKSQGKAGEDVAVVISRVFAQFVKQFATAGTQSPPVGEPDNAGPPKDGTV